MGKALGIGCNMGDNLAIVDNRISNTKTKKMDLDKYKIERFRLKVEEMKQDNNGGELDQLTILQDALKELNIIDEPVTNYYSIGDVIGSGKYGLVREAVSNNNHDHKVAVKTINLQNISSKHYIIAQEILTMKRIDHPNIVKIYEIYRELGQLHLVMEFVDGQELFDYIFEHNKLKESDAANIVKQLLQCIIYLNKMSIGHRDLKLENIVINRMSKKIKVLDFGFSSYFSQEGKMKTRVGTPYYIAPEILLGEYGPEGDMWSIGVITYILLSGSPPFHATTVNRILYKIVHSELKFDEQIWENVGLEAQEFVTNLLRKDPAKRLTPEQGLQHKWIKQK